MRVSESKTDRTNISSRTIQVALGSSIVIVILTLYPYPLSFILLSSLGRVSVSFSTPLRTVDIRSLPPVFLLCLPPFATPLFILFPLFVVLTWIGAFMASGLGAPHLRWLSLPRTCVPVDIAELVEGENPRS
ncbi:hypothetical protein FRC14_008101 [Serendipita sp. 396]|nr:hypothetical protein FRC14_008101 [Serendipita sp. 396]